MEISGGAGEVRGSRGILGRTVLGGFVEERFEGGVCVQDTDDVGRNSGQSGPFDRSNDRRSLRASVPAGAPEADIVGHAIADHDQRFGARTHGAGALDRLRTAASACLHKD